MIETYLDILVRFIHPDDRSASVNPETQYDNVHLEQMEWEPPDSSGFEAWYAENYGDPSQKTWAQMYNHFDEYMSYACTDGVFEAEIHAHKSREGLQYKMKAGRGEWIGGSPAAIETEQKIESLSIQGYSSYVFNNQNVVSVNCAEWESDVLDEYGNLLEPPDIKITTTNPEDENDKRLRLFWEGKVQGIIRCVFTIEYDVWFLQITPRDLSGSATSTSGRVDTMDKDTDELQTGVSASTTSGENRNCSDYYTDKDDPNSVYGTTVRAIWDGGFDSIDIEIPASLDVTCDPPGDSVIVDTPEDEPQEEEEKCFKIVKVIDTCSGEVVEEEKVEITCPEQQTTVI
jgi:hypothetical protein